MTPDELDAADPLAHCRSRFLLPPDIIYLDGNSLGAMPAAAPERLRQVAEEQWATDLIGSWNAHGWIDWPRRIAARLAPIVGAKPNELIIADSTSICLFKALGAAVSLDPSRKQIVARDDEFPTDLHVAAGLADLNPGVELIARDWQTLEASLDENVAVLMLSHVDYRSGHRFDMRHYNQAAHAAGALTLWDLSHSTGAIEVDLNGSGCDLAVGCGYKFLNGGPGAPAFLYVAEQLQDRLRSPIQGWMGHARPFDFAASYEPAPGIARFLTGTPSILALAALEAGLDTFAGVRMADVEAKGSALATLFIDTVERRCGVNLEWQRGRAGRGSHVVVPHPHAYAVIQALIERGVIGDFRPPDLMRFGFAPLYNGYAEVAQAAETLAEVLASGDWRQPRFAERKSVT